VLSLGPQEGWQPPIVTAEAVRGSGIDEIVERLDEHRAHIEAEGHLDERRRRNLRAEVIALATGRLRRRLEEGVDEDPEFGGLLDEVVARRLDPASAASALLERQAEEGEED
jgi:LAO/AO transport system kinase